VFLLAGIFYISVIPEVTDADMAQQAQITHVGEQAGEKRFWKQYRVFHAAFAQFCYVGAQGECCPSLFLLLTSFLKWPLPVISSTMSQRLGQIRVRLSELSFWLLLKDVLLSDGLLDPDS
jgi:hypothetical protein